MYTNQFATLTQLAVTEWAALVAPPIPKLVEMHQLSFQEELHAIDAARLSISPCPDMAFIASMMPNIRGRD
jgi:hypothetical protein